MISTRTTPHDNRRLRRVGRGFLALLVLSSVMIMFGCGGDDDDVEGIAVDTRISDDRSVIGLFEEAGADGFVFPAGLFGRTNSPTRLSFRNVNFERTPPAYEFTTTNLSTGDSEDGGGGGGASCTYLYANEPPENLIFCGLCDIVCTADNIEPGTEGPGECFLQLATADTPETRDNPPFQSEPFAAIIGLDIDGNVISINGVPVATEPEL